MSAQATLPVSGDTFPETVTDEQGNEYRLLAVDTQRRGHYWLQGGRTNRLVGVADTSLAVDTAAGTWLSERQVGEYLRGREWASVSEFGRSYLSEKADKEDQ